MILWHRSGDGTVTVLPGLAWNLLRAQAGINLGRLLSDPDIIMPDAELAPVLAYWAAEYGPQ